MKRSIAVRLLTLALVAVIDGCGGGGGGSNGSPGLPVNQPQSASATFVIKIPARSASSNSRTPHYVTSSVQGIDFTVTASPAPANGVAGGYVFYALTPQATYCSTGGSGLTCTLQVNAPPGNDTFVVHEYDSSSDTGIGYLVATGSLTQTINPNAANVVNIITYAVPIFIEVGVDQTPATGMAITPALDITASDADGNIIVGQFNGPITLSTAPANPHVTFSKTILNTSSDFTGLTVHYDGTPITPVGINAAPTFVNGNFSGWQNGFASFLPGAAGVQASPHSLYFAHANAAAQMVTISATNGAAGPFTMTASSVTNPPCTGYVTINSASAPTFTITPVASTFSTTPVNTVGICYVDAKPSTGQTMSIPVMISP